MVSQVSLQDKFIKKKVLSNSLEAAGLSTEKAKLLVGLNLENLKDEEIKSKLVSLGFDESEVTLALALLAVQRKQKVAENLNTKEKKKGFFQSVKNAIARISESASVPFGASAAFAIAGISILATIGMAAGLASIISKYAGPSSDAQIEKAISKNQQNTYKLRQDSKELSSNIEEADRLSSKNLTTEKDKEEYAALMDALRQSNEA